MALMDIRGLSVQYRLDRGVVQAVQDVSFQLEKGEILGIVGESGCGKTTIAKALLRILPENGRISEGSILFKGMDLATLAETEMKDVRWRDISLISQSAMNSLNPVYTVGKQIVEAIQIHEKTSFRKAWERAEEAFALVGLEGKRLSSYPHQLSGGMRQRAVIAMALILRPDLILADEPTTALDVLVQDHILREIVAIQGKIKNSMIIITHDIGVVAETCHRIIIMYAGRIMEVGSVRSVFGSPGHPYTIGLQKAFPNIKDHDSQLVSIPGYPPSLIDPPVCCLFAERCPFVQEPCRKSFPPERQIEPGHLVRCHFADRAPEFRRQSREGDVWGDPAESRRTI
jgi:peptide/nickel transport system ATP-binding protein